MQYVDQFIEKLNAAESIDIDIVAQHHGRLVVAASRYHLAGSHSTGDLLLHRLGEMKRTTRALFRL